MMMMNSMERSSRSRSRPRSSVTIGNDPVTILETPLDDDDGNEGDQEDNPCQSFGPMDDDDDYDEREESYLDQSPMVTLPIHYGHQQEIGIYGWRKKSVYILLATIILLVLINLFLTFWIITILGVSSSGIRGIDLSSNDDQIIINGTAIFSKLLFASEVASLDGQSLKFTAKNQDLIIRSWWNNEKNETDETRLILTRNKIVLYTDKFEIRNRKNQLMFSLDSDDSIQEKSKEEDSIKKQLTLNINSIKVAKPNNSLSLPVALQTSLVDHSGGEELRLFSPQGRLILLGPKSVHMESKLGPGSIVSFDDLTLRSNRGPITFESNYAIYMRHLRLIEPKNQTNISTIDELMPRSPVYQVCICKKTGKLFMSPPEIDCIIESYRDCR